MFLKKLGFADLCKDMFIELKNPSRKIQKL